MTEVSVVRCNSYDQPQVCAKVKEAINLLGGVTNFIKPGSRVLVKPNLLMAKEPASGIDTHPEVVRAAVKVLKEINCKILIGDGPSAWGAQAENIDAVYERSGIKAISEQEGVELVKFERKRWREKFPLAAWLDNCDYLVNVPKFKTHDLMLLTGAIKNLFGLVWGIYKTELHKNYFNLNDFAKILVDIYEEARPALTVVDGIIAMEADGPATSGKLRQQNLLLAGSDCVAIDTALALIMGVNPFDVLTTKEASRRGLGVSDIQSITILGERLADVIGEPFILPSTSFKKKLPPFIVNTAKKLIKYYPCVEQDNCIRCAACIQACPVKVIKMNKKGITFDYSGCISCFCCQEVCPASAIKIKKSLFAKLIGL